MSESDSTVQRTGAGPPAHMIPPIAEALGYAGGALALAALMTLVAMFWGDLGVWGRSGIAAVVAIAGFAGGFSLERLNEPAAKRLSQFLLSLAVAAVGCVAGFLTHYIVTQQLVGATTVSEARETAAEWGWFVGMFAVAVSGGLVWWKRRTWLQHLAFGLGVGMSALLVLPLVPVEGPAWGAGLVLALVGVAWGAMALRGWIPPENAGLLLSTAGIIGGIELMALGESFGEKGLLVWALWLGFAASLALIAGGTWLTKLIVVGMGAAGVVLFGIELVTEFFSGLAMPVAFLAIGLVLIVASTYMTRRSAVGEKKATRVVTEIAGYAGAAFVYAGTMTLFGEHWNEMNTATRIIVPAVISVIAYGCGLLASRTDTESAHRLSQVLLGGGVVAAACAVGMVAYPAADSMLGPRVVADAYQPARDPANWAVFIGALSAIVFGGITWSLKRGAFTEMVTGAACFVSVVSVMELLPRDQLSFWWPGAAMLALGLAWVVMGLLERFKPSNWAVGIGCMLAIMGTMMLQEGPQGSLQKWPAILGIGLSVTAITASIVLKRAVLLGFGAGGMVIFAFMTVQFFFEGDIAGPIALLVTGVVFIAMAVLVARVMPRLRGPSSRSGEVKAS